MRFLIAIILGCFSFIGYSQSDSLNQTDDEGLKQGYWIIYGVDKPERGWCDSCKIEEGTYLNNRKDGQWIKYHKDGVHPRLIGTYKNNRPWGPYQKFGSNNRLMEIGTFERGKQLGEFVKYDSCGKVVYSGFYNDDGKKDGWHRYFYPTCHCADSTKEYLEIEVHYENGIARSMYRYWLSGCLKEKVFYAESGSVTSKQNFKDTCATNDCIQYVDPNPPIDPEPPIKPPKFDPNGYNKIYNQNDELWMDGNFKNGKLWEGKLYVYDNDGVLTKVEIWKNGKYHADGQL